MKAVLFSYGGFFNNFAFLIVSTVLAQGVLEPSHFLVWLFFGLPVALFFMIDASLANVFTRSLIFSARYDDPSDEGLARFDARTIGEIGVLTLIQLAGFAVGGWLYLRILGGNLFDTDTTSVATVYTALVVLVALNSLSLPHRSLLYARERVIDQKRIQFVGGLVKLALALAALWAAPGFATLAGAWIVGVALELVLFLRASDYRWRLVPGDLRLRNLRRQKRILSASLLNRVVVHFSANAASLASVGLGPQLGIEVQTAVLFFTRLILACEAVGLTPLSVSIPTIVRRRARRQMVDPALADEFVRLVLIGNVLFALAFGGVFGLGFLFAAAAGPGGIGFWPSGEGVALGAAVFAFGIVSANAKAHILFFETNDRNPFLIISAVQGILVALLFSVIVAHFGLVSVYALQLLFTLVFVLVPAFFGNLSTLNKSVAGYHLTMWREARRGLQLVAQQVRGGKPGA